MRLLFKFPSQIAHCCCLETQLISCVLIMYPVTLLNLLIRFSRFLWDFFLIDTVMSSVNRVLLLSNLLPFISYLYLISLGLEISVLCSVALVEGAFCLGLDFRGKDLHLYC